MVLPFNPKNRVRTRMLKRIVILVLIALSGIVLLGIAQSNPTKANLQLAHESLISAITSGNLTLAQAMIHPNALGFFRESQRFVELRADYGAADALPSVIEDISQFNGYTFDVSYRVVGNTGIVCMANILEAKKWSKAKDRHTRSTYVYVNVGGNWKLLSWHTSSIPLNK